MDLENYDGANKTSRKDIMGRIRRNKTIAACFANVKDSQIKEMSKTLSFNILKTNDKKEFE
jgi:hypothetical protein